MAVYRRHFKSMIMTVKLSMGCIQTYEKYPELFGKNAFLGIFSQDMNKNISSLPKKAFAICLSLSQASRFTTFLFGHAQKSKFDFFFSPFLFLLFLSFCCSGRPSTGLASSSRVPEKASSRRAMYTTE